VHFLAGRAPALVAPSAEYGTGPILDGPSRRGQSRRALVTGHQCLAGKSPGNNVRAGQPPCEPDRGFIELARVPGLIPTFAFPRWCRLFWRAAVTWSAARDLVFYAADLDLWDRQVPGVFVPLTCSFHLDMKPRLTAVSNGRRVSSAGAPSWRHFGRLACSYIDEVGVVGGQTRPAVRGRPGCWGSRRCVSRGVRQQQRCHLFRP
jgi:hypothetical protein